MREPQENSTSTSLLQMKWFCLAAALESVLAFLVMLVIPGDPKNAWLLGFSRTRVFIILLFLVFALIFGGAFLWLRKGGQRAAAWQMQIAAGLTRPAPAILLTVSALLGMGAALWGIAPAFRRMLGFDLMTRLLPPLVWGLFFCLQLLVFSVFVWRNHLKTRQKSRAGLAPIDPKGLHWVLVYCGVLLLLVGTAVQLAAHRMSPDLLERFISAKDFVTLHIKFNLGFENNLPNTYAALILLVLAVQLFWIARGCRQQNNPTAGRWTALGIVALFFSLNEIAFLQKHAIAPIRSALHLQGMWQNAWYLPLLPVLLVVILWSLPALHGLTRSQMRRLIAGALIGAGGVIGMNLLGELAALQFGMYDLSTALWRSAERAAEFISVWLFSSVAVELMPVFLPGINFEVTRKAQTRGQLPSDETVNLSVRNLPSKLAAAAGFFVLVNVVLYLIDYAPKFQGLQNVLSWEMRQTLFDAFNLEVESAIPTYFSFLLLLIVTTLLYFIAVQRGATDPGWMGLAIVFLFLSIDEASSLHELLFDVVTASGQPSGILHYAWYIPVIPALAVFGLIYLRFWLRLPTFEKIFFIVSAIIYLVGVIGMEAVSGCFDELQGVNSLAYNLAMLVEEMMEMGGMILFILTLLHYMAHWQPQFKVLITNQSQALKEAA